MKVASVEKNPVLIRTALEADNAFQRLRKAILTGELKQGETLREARIAREWQMGRMLIRQAVRRAAEFGYVTLRPNRAPVVRQLSTDDIENIYSMREGLESMALKRAWKDISPEAVQAVRTLAEAVEREKGFEKRLQNQFKLDEELHDLWISRCQNMWLIEALERLFIYRPNQLPILRNHPQLAEIGYRDHLEILDSFAKKSFATTDRLLRSHIRRAMEGLIEFMSEIESG